MSLNKHSFTSTKPFCIAKFDLFEMCKEENRIYLVILK